MYLCISTLIFTASRCTMQGSCDNVNPDTERSPALSSSRGTAVCAEDRVLQALRIKLSPLDWSWINLVQLLQFSLKQPSKRSIVWESNKAADWWYLLSLQSLVSLSCVNKQIGAQALWASWVIKFEAITWNRASCCHHCLLVQKLPRRSICHHNLKTFRVLPREEEK